ncbi:MAG: SlyX family protein [Pseudomonadota bacterium]
MPTDSERLDALEARLEFQDETIATLNDALVDQQAQLTHLSKQYELVIARLQSLAGHQFEDHEPPPHY